MKFLIALDSFKGSCSAKNACNAVAKGINRSIPEAEIVTVPISDGGEGFIETLYDTLRKDGFEKIVCEVTGPYLETVKSTFLTKGKCAIIEMAQSSGLELTSVRDTKNATSFGFGQVVKFALDNGCTEFWFGLGGSATNDGGAGFAQALGFRFFDEKGNEFKEPICGKDLINIKSIKLSEDYEKLKKCKFYGTCDVENPLLGKLGATAIFGPQKGATDNDLESLEEGMENYSKVLTATFGNDYSDENGAGAAGGMGAALKWFCKAELKRGIEVVLDLLKVDDILKDASFVFVGEGRMDGQSAQGKAPVGVAMRAKKYNIPVIALCGQIRNDAAVLYDYNVNAMFSICNGPMSLDYSMMNGEQLLELSAENITNLIKRLV